MIASMPLLKPAIVALIKSINSPSILGDRYAPNAAINLDNEGMIKLKAEGYTVSARGGFNVSQVSMNLQTPMKREAPLIALA